MPDITITNSWPSTLPLPTVDYTGTSVVPTLHSQARAGRHRARRRFTRTYAMLNLEWCFTKAEYDAFISFYLTSLGNGTAKFTIELRYPKNSALTEWVVQFTGEITITTTDESIFKVSVPVMIQMEPTVAAKAASSDNLFYVQGEDSDGLPLEVFYVIDDSSSGAGTDPFIVLEG